VVQIGGPTFADAVYIDINTMALPSGLAKFEYGMKVMRGGPRGNNQWYEPRYHWPGGPMTDEALAQWVDSLPAAQKQPGPVLAGGVQGRVLPRDRRSERDRQCPLSIQCCRDSLRPIPPVGADIAR
jgi:hypothetical protein